MVVGVVQSDLFVGCVLEGPINQKETYQWHAFLVFICLLLCVQKGGWNNMVLRHPVKEIRILSDELIEILSLVLIANVNNCKFTRCVWNLNVIWRHLCRQQFLVESCSDCWFSSESHCYFVCLTRKTFHTFRLWFLPVWLKDLRCYGTVLFALPLRLVVF